MSWLSLMELACVVVQPVVEHLGRVLAEEWWWDPDRARGSVDLPWSADLPDPPRLRVFDLHRHLTLGRQGAGKRLVDAENRPRRNPKRLEALEPLLAGVVPQVAFDGSDQCGPRGLAQRVGGKPRVGRKLGCPNRFAETHELRVARDRHVDEPIAHRERPVGRNGGVVVALLRGDLT